MTEYNTPIRQGHGEPKSARSFPDTLKELSGGPGRGEGLFRRHGQKQGQPVDCPCDRRLEQLLATAYYK